eukprot:TRINITY_DN2821_c0_g1_i1.p1 TRINITY_DN2821_c0_g1~~TRINITY_DN2821_c0_g1_i1.p1  ORF type:complete len:203 (+),score=27.59 TRINITY_DN2821_c0_g1_i1:36-644(+)
MEQAGNTPDIEEENKSDFSIKHPLQHGWCWWYDIQKKKNKSQSSWGDNIKKIYTFSTVEDFWCLWNNIKGAHELAYGSNYHLFKEGIEPKWEDPSNTNGGKWLVELQTSKSEQVNQVWLWAVLSCIGCSYDDEDEICGVVISIRKGKNKIALWTKSCDKDKMERIGEQFREQLGLEYKIGFYSHKDSMASATTYNMTPKYEV